MEVSAVGWYPVRRWWCHISLTLPGCRADNECVREMFLSFFFFFFFFFGGNVRWGCQNVPNLQRNSFAILQFDLLCDKICANGCLVCVCESLVDELARVITGVIERTG
jgi:hypothetical protein